jgi:osmotically-inducible protein OsmY
LLRALAGVAGEISAGPKADETIREHVLAELDRQPWASRHLIDATVRNEVVELWGVVVDARQRDGARVAAETVPGVKVVKSHIAWVEPMSGMAFSDPEDDQANLAPAAQQTELKQAVNG